jgi:hypothetical protein
MAGWLMHKRMERIWMEVVVAKFKSSSYNFFEGRIEKITKRLGKGNRYQDLNGAPPKMKSECLPLEKERLIGASDERLSYFEIGHGPMTLCICGC